MGASLNKIVSSLSLFFSLSAFAQIDKFDSSIAINPKLPLDIEYDFPGWNKNKNQIETGFLIVKDAKTGRVAKIVLQETEVDSGVFIGQYVLTFAYEQTEVSPEIYTPPQSMIEKTDSLKAMAKLIETGALLRKPSLVRKSKRGFQKLHVYDSRDQAMEALEKLRKNPNAKSTVDPSVLESQQKAAFEAEKLRLEKEAAAREIERTRLAQLEAKRVEELRKEKERLSAAEKARRAAEARKLSTQGMNLYTAENFTEAEKLFKQAADLDPSNRSFFFQYGITLYRLQKYNDSLVALKMAGDADVDKNQIALYAGLGHMQLKEYNEALNKLTPIENANDPTLGPTAGLYAGIIEYTRENYGPAKKHFEYVIDNSKDNPQLDAQAEAYIEQIASIQQFEEERKKKVIVGLNIGEQYDSNVLQVPSGDTTGTPTDKAGWRTMLMASLAYRTIYTKTNELSVSVNYLDMYTLNDKFKASSTLQDADPQILGFSIPYKLKLTSYQLAFTPGAETMNLNSDGTGSREVMTRSQYAKADNTFVVNDHFFSNLNLEWRNDDSIPSGTDTLDATKMTISSVNTKFMDAKNTVGWSAELIYQMNNAKGDDEKFNRMELAFGHLRPSFWETLMMARLGFASQIYPDHSASRKDSNLGVNLSFIKTFTPKTTGSLMATYNQNTSNVSLYKYDKYTLMTLFSWNFGL